MTKNDAIDIIVHEARLERGSRTAMLRLIRALQTLGLFGNELALAMRRADYWDANDEPYPRYRKREKP